MCCLVDSLTYEGKELETSDYGADTRGKGMYVTVGWIHTDFICHTK